MRISPAGRRVQWNGEPPDCNNPAGAHVEAAVAHRGARDGIRVDMGSAIVSEIVRSPHDHSRVPFTMLRVPNIGANGRG